MDMYSPTANAPSPAASTLPCDTLAEGSAFEALGGWKDGSGWEFDLRMAFDRVSLDTGDVHGRSTWVLRGVPARHAEAYGGKVGLSAVEHFRGETSGRSVTVKGHATDDPHDIIAPGQYVLAIVKQRDMWQHESDDEDEDEEDGPYSPHDSRAAPQKHQIALGKCAERRVQMIRYRQPKPQASSPQQRELSPMVDRTNEPEPEPEPVLEPCTLEPCTLEASPPSRAVDPAAEPFLPWVER